MEVELNKIHSERSQFKGTHSKIRNAENREYQNEIPTHTHNDHIQVDSSNANLCRINAGATTAHA